MMNKFMETQKKIEKVIASQFVRNGQEIHTQERERFEQIFAIREN